MPCQKLYILSFSITFPYLETAISELPQFLTSYTHLITCLAIVFHLRPEGCHWLHFLQHHPLWLLGSTAVQRWREQRLQTGHWLSPTSWMRRRETRGNWGWGGSYTIKINAMSVLYWSEYLTHSHTHLCVVWNVTGLLLDLRQLLFLHESQLFLMLLELFCCEYWQTNKQTDIEHNYYHQCIYPSRLYPPYSYNCYQNALINNFLLCTRNTLICSSI